MNAGKYYVEVFDRVTKSYSRRWMTWNLSEEAWRELGFGEEVREVFFLELRRWTSLEGTIVQELMDTKRSTEPWVEVNGFKVKGSFAEVCDAVREK